MQEELIKQIWLEGPKTSKEEDRREFSMVFSAIQNLFDSRQRRIGGNYYNYSLGVYTERPHLYVLLFENWPQIEELEEILEWKVTEDMYRLTSGWEIDKWGSFLHKVQIAEPRDLSPLWEEIKERLELGCNQYNDVTVDNNIWIYNDYSHLLHVLRLKDKEVLIKESGKCTGHYCIRYCTNPLHKLHECFILLLSAEAVREDFHRTGRMEGSLRTFSEIFRQKLPTTQVLTTRGRTLLISDYVKSEYLALTPEWLGLDKGMLDEGVIVGPTE